MKRGILILFFVLSLLSCKGQDFINWFSNPPCTEGYGLLYNWYATTDARKITSSDDWVVPTQSDLGILIYPDWDINGGKLKEAGTTYWQTPNTGATNEWGFNARAAGDRSGISGEFQNILLYCNILSDYSVGNETRGLNLSYNSNEATEYQDFTTGKSGYSIRLLYTGTGTPTSYTDNSGNVYRVVTIGSQTWLADNLRDVRFRNGDIIPFHGADNGNNFTNAEWSALVTSGVCAYNSDVANVGCNFTFPAE